VLTARLIAHSACSQRAARVQIESAALGRSRCLAAEKRLRCDAARRGDAPLQETRARRRSSSKNKREP
jgi:hypothetical protein